jgi:predicted dehydrogenase
MRTLGVGMVGYGFIGKVHSHAHRALPLFYDPPPARTRLVGVCTTSDETGIKAEQQAEFQFHTTDHRALLERDDIDILHICTPNDAHYAAVRDALAAGKHVYCDKPLAHNPIEARELAELASRANVVHQMTFNYRFIPAVMRAVQLIDEGFLGDLFTCRAAYLHAGYIDPKRPFSWRTDFARSGGGAIMDLGAHVIDLMRFLLERPAVKRGGSFAEVSADLETVIPERLEARTGVLRTVDVDDIAHVRFRLSGGATGVLEASRLATGVQDDLRFELHGSRGSLRFNLMDANWLDAYDATVPEGALGGDRGYRRIECVTRYPKPYALGATKNTVGWLNFHIQSLYDFVANVVRVEEGSPVNSWSPTFADGLAAQEIVGACQRSSADDGAWNPVSAQEFGAPSGQAA